MQVLGSLNEPVVLAFKVSDPKRLEGEDSFTVYTVTIQVTIKATGKKSGLSVLRRFSDFQWLYKQLRGLKISQKVYFPSFPNGSVFGRFDEAVVEERRKAAHVLLQFAGAHKELYQSEAFKTFFSTSVKPSSNKISEKVVVYGSTVIEEFESRTGPVTLAEFSIVSVDGKNVIVKRDRSGALFVIRTLLKPTAEELEDDITAQTSTQYPVMSALGNAHPFVLSLQYLFQTEDKVFLVLEYVGATELFTRLAPPYPDDIVRFFAAELTLAIGFLHSKKVVCKSITPCNVMVDQAGHIKLSYYHLKNEEGFDVGLYRAPEAVVETNITSRCDWWSLGAIMYHMLLGHPLDDDFPLGLFPHSSLVLRGRMSDEAAALVGGLLTYDPNDRLGCGVLDHEEIMSHPFFHNVNWDLLKERMVDPPAMAAAQVASSVQSEQSFTASQPRRSWSRSLSLSFDPSKSMPVFSSSSALPVTNDVFDDTLASEPVQSPFVSKTIRPPSKVWAGSAAVVTTDSEE